VRRIVREEIERAIRKDPGKRAAIIASRGTLDWAYPPLVISTAAAAAGMEVSMFFTSQGIDIVHRDFASKLSASRAEPTPDLEAALPGMVEIATTMMKSMSQAKSVATIRDLLDAAREAGVRLIACETTRELLGYPRDAFQPGVEFGNAAAFLTEARDAHLALFH
jgi:peroxiredoxin family protein